MARFMNHGLAIFLFVVVSHIYFGISPFIGLFTRMDALKIEYFSTVTGVFNVNYGFKLKMLK